MIENVNLSFSDLCGGGCFYCPKNRATSNKKDRIMSPKTFVTIIKQIKEFPIKTITISENGDCFLNPNVVKFLKIIRKHMPKTKIVAYTNFQNIDKYIDEICYFNLLDVLGVNINTINPKYNKCISNIDYKQSIIKLKKIIEFREKYKASFKIQVFVLVLRQYIDYCKKKTDKFPINLKKIDVIDDYKETYKQIKPILKRGDTINRTFTFLWAETKNIKIPNQNYTCPMMEQNNKSVFINPNGIVYLCCYDSNYDLSYGDIKERPLIDIVSCSVRSCLLNKIKNKEYDKIGFPCSHVELCQRLKPTLKAKILSKIL